MLKNIPKMISPELLKVLCEMGHGDEIVIADGNFPAAANAKILSGLTQLLQQAKKSNMLILF